MNIRISRIINVPDEIVKGWVEYSGPYGGHGWRNTETGEVRYQKNRPEERGEGRKTEGVEGGGGGGGGATPNASQAAYRMTGRIRRGQPVRAERTKGGYIVRPLAMKPTDFTYIRQPGMKLLDKQIIPSTIKQVGRLYKRLGKKGVKAKIEKIRLKKVSKRKFHVEVHISGIYKHVVLSRAELLDMIGMEEYERRKRRMSRTKQTRTKQGQ